MAAATLLGVVTGWLSIRRQGMYFAMITLALSQLVYFIYVRSPFTGGENGIQQVPRGYLFGFIDLEQRPDALLRDRHHLHGLLPAGIPDHSLAIRSGGEGYS